MKNRIRRTRHQQLTDDPVAAIRAWLEREGRGDLLAELDAEAKITRDAIALAEQNAAVFVSWYSEAPVPTRRTPMYPEWTPILATKAELDFVFGPDDSERRSAHATLVLSETSETSRRRAVSMATVPVTRARLAVLR